MPASLQNKERGHPNIISYPSGVKAFFAYEPLTQETVEQLRQFEVNRIVIRTYKQWQIGDFSSLNKFIASLYVEDQETPTDIISSLTNLEELYLSYSHLGIDFSNFPHLKECFLNKIKTLPKSLESCAKLKILKIANSKIKAFDNLASFKYLNP